MVCMPYVLYNYIHKPLLNIFTAQNLDYIVPINDYVLFTAGLTGDDCRQCVVVDIMNDAIYEGDDQMFSMIVNGGDLGCSSSINNIASVQIIEDANDGNYIYKSLISLKCI